MNDDSNLHDELISEEQLEQWTGFSRRADIRKFLENIGLTVLPGRGGRICITRTEIREARTRMKQGASNDDIQFTE